MSHRGEPVQLFLLRPPLGQLPFLQKPLTKLLERPHISARRIRTRRRGGERCAAILQHRLGPRDVVALLGNPIPVPLALCRIVNRGRRTQTIGKRGLALCDVTFGAIDGSRGLGTQAKGDLFLLATQGQRSFSAKDEARHGGLQCVEHRKRCLETAGRVGTLTKEVVDPITFGQRFIDARIAARDVGADAEQVLGFLDR